DWTAASISGRPAVPSAPFFESSGFSAFCNYLKTVIGPDRPCGPEGFALAVPFAVDHERGYVASNRLGDWPDSQAEYLTAVDDELALTCLVLNDAVAFALGCPAREYESGPPANLCLTLGTNFGCAILRKSSIAEPVEVNKLLSNIAWPT